MSLHIETSEEAREELDKQNRRSLFSAFLITALTFILITLLFLTVKIVMMDKVISQMSVIPLPLPTSHENIVEPADVPAPSTPQSAVAASPPSILTANTPLPTDINLPPVPPSSTAQPITIGHDIAMPGMPGNDISSPGATPQAFSKRCSLIDRLQRIKQSGGSEKYEEAVVRGLRWLMKTQNQDGSWGSGPNCASFTGMSLLAYLAHCETPYSEEFGESCQKAISWLVSTGAKNKGYLSLTPTDKYLPYEHAVNTYALSEAYTFCNLIGMDIPGLRESLEKAVSLIVKNQTTDGSWMYFYALKPSGESYPDLSISGWNIQALKAARHAGLKIDAPVLLRAGKFVASMGNAKTGLFQYREGEPRPSMTPVGVLSLQMLGQAHTKEARAGIKYMETNIKPDITDCYTYYYAAQALLNRGGEAWDGFGRKLGDTLVSRQQANGTWTPPAGLISGHINNAGKLHYQTCLTLLTLEVYYRFLPGTGENL